MKRFSGTILFASFLLVMTGCSSQSPTGPSETAVTLKPECGRFGISSLGKLAKKSAAAAVKEGPQVTFDLGAIKGSSGFFFLLYNVGMTPITDVTLSIDNAAFAVFPASMDTLIPGSDVGMLPVVKVSAFHGTPLDGVGSRPLLPMGDNTFTLQIRGKSKTSAGADTTIILNAAMNLEALVMDFAIESGAGQMDLSSSTAGYGSLFPGIDGLENEPVFSGLTRCVDDHDIIVKNRGNIPLHLSVYSSEATSDAQVIAALRFDSTIVIDGECLFSFNADAVNQHFLIIASGENTVSDPQKLPLHDNGSFYMVVAQSSADCEDTLVNKKFADFLAAHTNDDCAKAWLLIDNRLCFYGQSFNGSDSVYFTLTDLTTDALITGCTGTKTGDETVLVQTDGYTGEYLNLFRSAISLILQKLDAKGLSGHVSGGGMSGTWVSSSSVTFE